MKLRKGIYEQVINKALNDEIQKNINDLDVYKEKIDLTDSSSILSSYLKYVLNNGLDYYKSSKVDLDKQIEIVNRLISEFSKIIKDGEFNNYQIDENTLIKTIKYLYENNSSKMVKDGTFTTVLKQQCGKRRLEVINKILNVEEDY